MLSCFFFFFLINTLFPVLKILITACFEHNVYQDEDVATECFLKNTTCRQMRMCFISPKNQSTFYKKKTRVFVASAVNCGLVVLDAAPERSSMLGKRQAKREPVRKF